MRALALALLLLVAAQASAQVVRRSTVSGELASASADVLAGQLDVVVFEVPVDRSFVLTQACIGRIQSSGIIVVAPTAHLVGSELGIVPLLPSQCTLFEPGLAFKRGESIRCELSVQVGSDTPCLITGVLDGRGERGRR